MVNGESYQYRALAAADAADSAHYVGFRLRAHVSLRPVFNRQVFEANEIVIVRRDQHESVDVRDRCNLSINERCRSSQRLKASAFSAVPRCCGLVVGQVRKRTSDDILQVSFESSPSPALRQPATTVRQFVPDGCGDRTLGAMLVQTLEDLGIGSFRDGRRDDVRIQQVADRHKDTLRPVVLSRVETAKSLSTPISAREYFFRNLL